MNIQKILNGNISGRVLGRCLSKDVSSRNNEKIILISKNLNGWKLTLPDGTVRTTSDSKQQIQNVTNSLGYALKEE